MKKIKERKENNNNNNNNNKLRKATLGKLLRDGVERMGFSCQAHRYHLELNGTKETTNQKE